MRDLVAASIEGLPKTSAAPPGREIDCWIATLDTEDQVALLSRVARGETGVEAELMRRFRRYATGPAKPPVLRTAGTLRALAEEFAEHRRRGTVARETKERKRREHEQTAARERHLTTLAKRQADAWRLVDTKRPHDYDSAITLLKDLREIGEPKGRGAEVAERIRALREAHAKKSSLLARLRTAGL